MFDYAQGQFSLYLSLHVFLSLLATSAAQRFSHYTEWCCQGWQMFSSIGNFLSAYMASHPRTTLPVGQTIYRWIVGWLISNELERIWKEAIVTWSRYSPRICSEGLCEFVKAPSRDSNLSIHRSENIKSLLKIDQFKFCIHFLLSSSLSVVLLSRSWWNVLTCRPIAKQQMGKQATVRQPLLGNSSMDTFRRQGENTQ
jgi:hypothetical protein